MIRTFLICTLLISTLSSSANAQSRTAADVEKDLRKAAKTSVATYRSNGMSGLIGKTRECYKNLDKYKFYCVYFDLASRRIDQIFVAGMNFPPTEYFDDDEFGARVGPVFIRANMDMKQANKYLEELTPVINKLVEDNMRKKK
jgi:hypothetical protein